MVTEAENGDRKTVDEEAIVVGREAVISALREHMRTLRSSTDWGIMIAVGVILYVFAASWDLEFEILGIKFKRNNIHAAYITAGAIYSLVILALAFHLSRTRSILILARGLLGDSSYKNFGVELVAPVVTFSWIFNPFCYYGGVNSKECVLNSKRGGFRRRYRILKRFIRNKDRFRKILKVYMRSRPTGLRGGSY